MRLLIGIFIGLMGIVLGSFVNVVIYRVPAGRSISRPRSSCPTCGIQIAGFDNIPILSWLILRGRCRLCAAPISVRYPAVELLCGLLFVFSFEVVGLSPALLVVLLADTVGLAASVIDLDTRRIPNQLTFWGGLILGAAAVVVSAWSGKASLLLEAAVGALVGSLVLLVIALVSRGGMGMGDVKFAGVLGVPVGLLGLKLLFYFLLASFSIGSVVGIALITLKKVDRKGKVPFGPFLFCGFLSVQLISYLFPTLKL